MTETENNVFLETYTRQCSGSEEITRNSVEMEFHPFQSKELDPRIRFSFGKTTAQNVTKEEAPRVISRKIRVGMTFSAELARNCADEIAHSLLLDENQRLTRDIVQMSNRYLFTVYSRGLRSGKADSGGMISRTSGRSGSGKRETSACAPKFVQFVLAAALMEWYLQTRTNTPINYKTILVLQAPKAPTGPAGRLPSSRRPRRPRRPFPSPSPPPTVLNF
ncbi:hypothetical protein ALC57_04805 [Trachymyrmex cornetzi]|uniref:Uncharacterized protein n=1 Tax=Trachymyrmex cornetzi TaxID=471704 RepID=A0A195ED35_9HYME|nr:hypothetical protein ALC57_04805 [Trachymyrmex cornetzi]